ncbi:hairy and enhancer of split related-7 [Trichomycterus rosablanca]|uniref:hairy and enhancer of split related-7 n=1 Tax=Trichomycterus rosablanca TaxID=2290929 RepID=UPI002F35AD88
MDWNTTVTVNQLEEPERMKTDRKLMKPQVERRRRERMNRSLDNLRTLLLQGPEHQTGSQRRVEKAEILEHTVLFLQTSMADAQKSKRQEESTEEHQFLDGFSTCLQKAVWFLQEESKNRGQQDTLSSSLYQCLSRPHISQTSHLKHTPKVKITPDMRNSGKQGLQCVRKHALSHPYRVPLRHTEPNTVQHHATTTAASQPTTSSPQAAVQQCVWRPWP